MDRFKFKKTHIPFTPLNIDLLPVTRAFMLLDAERAGLNIKAAWKRVFYFITGFAVFLLMLSYGVGTGVSLYYLIRVLIQ